jgi:pyrimidine-nucleoside phosphorylase
MQAVDIIRKKRGGNPLTAGEIHFFVGAYAAGEISDAQAAAWLMAVVWRGMSREELIALTEAMLRSGDIIDLSALPGIKVDKQSTGGVGDKTSLVVAAVAAAGDLVVPMICGRGWSYAGGTLDKLESIPGFKTELTIDEFRAALAVCGCALAGQSSILAPAEKKLYALRAATGAIESPWLICASLLSRKLAEGADALVLDVKCGAGGFMKRSEDAECLAQLLVDTAGAMGKRAVALVTDMDQPLGRAIGNALEIAECIDVLRGGGPPDLRMLSLELCGWMFYLGERTASVELGRELAAELLAGGSALQKLRSIFYQQHGDELALFERQRLPHATFREDVCSALSGYVAGIDCERLGTACALLGGGRQTMDEAIDPAVGLVLHKKIGDVVTEQEPLVTVHFNSSGRLEEVTAMVRAAFKVSNAARYVPQPLVQKVIERTAASRGRGAS